MNQIISRFPESLFPAQNAGRYLKSLMRGYRRCQESTVSILGLARDLDWVCPYTIARINRLGDMFGDYRVLILENDSADNTATRLVREAKKNRRWEVVSDKLNAEKYGSTKEEARAVRMAGYRNRLLELAKCHPADYIILVDMDLEGGFSYDGVAHTFSLPNWDFVGSNSILYEEYEGKMRRLFYDSWAYRRLGSISAHLDTEINLLKFNRGDPLVPVTSCFGGLGIYKSEVYFSGSKYSHLNELGEVECDHVTFHAALRKAGYNNIYMNPSQISLYNKTVYVL